MSAEHTFGLVMALAGAGIMAGGLFWHFLEPTDDARKAATHGTSIVPWTTGNAGGPSASGAF
jgi:hypothetical protein